MHRGDRGAPVVNRRYDYIYIYLEETGDNRSIERRNSPFEKGNRHGTIIIYIYIESISLCTESNASRRAIGVLLNGVSKVNYVSRTNER